MATTKPPTRRSEYPQVLGVPGLSLSRAGTWATSEEAREQGRKGEERTAAVLAELAVPGGPTLLHSLRLPMSGVEADIDHVIVAGRNVWVLDSKLWKPARYWTVFGVTRRGWRRVPFADKHTSEMAVEALRSLFVRAGVRAVVHQPFLVVWPSSEKQPVRLGLYRPRGAKAIHGDALESRLGKLAAGGVADQAIVALLYPLLTTARLASTQSPVRREVLDEF